MDTNVQQDKQQEPKRLSKWGIWRRNPNREVWVINNMKAVLK